MAAENSAYGYDDRVFINCPFDEKYLPLFRAAIFTTYICGFCPISSLAEDNGLDSRMDKIFRIIEKYRYGIHDISRTELNPARLPRFNMPFELGFFYGARYFGNKHQKTKNALILERKQYSHQQFLSDINGIDLQAHENDPRKIIQHIRNWLCINSRRIDMPGINLIWANYLEFLSRLPELCISMGFSSNKEIPFADYCNIVVGWLNKAYL